MTELTQLLVMLSEERRSYILRHLPWQLVESGEFDRLYRLLTDIFFLEAKIQEVSVFDLTADFTCALEVIPDDHPHRKILRLLEEAIRWDIHFIARHVQDCLQGIFQCLWNSCGCNCPEAADCNEPEDY